jgi:hypothetical protein
MSLGGSWSFVSRPGSPSPNGTNWTEETFIMSGEAEPALYEDRAPASSPSLFSINSSLADGVDFTTHAASATDLAERTPGHVRV